MKFYAILLAASMFAACTPKETECTVAVVPQPVSVTQYEGSHKYSGAVVTRLDKKLGEEEYVLDTRRARPGITGGSEAGIYYGKVTLGQIAEQTGGEVPCLLIKDKPQFAYRGAMLDCCRHFFPLEDVKKFIDIMAEHKLNVFHWHLTEDQGWRIEIKKYPKLTSVGSVRKCTKVGHYRDVELGFDGIEHGGFYTQDECREIVAYAAERHITVVPEIEMPGHASAALAAYPELGCTGGPYEVICNWGIYPDIFCAGKDTVIRFLEGVLDEVCDIFPGEYIHIGGDEAPRDRWKECPDCQAKMKELGYESEAQLQSYIVNTIEAYLNAKGRKIIGWDEILEGGVSQSATVMSWRGAKGGKAAAALGNDVVMAPNSHFYFDYYQTASREGEPLGIGGHLNLRKAYSFDPFEDLDDEVKAHIKGIQANLWTEYIADFDNAEFHLLPRLAALSEVAWNAGGRTDYDAFVERVRKVLVPEYEAAGYTYADFAFRNPPVE